VLLHCSNGFEAVGFNAMTSANLTKDKILNSNVHVRAPQSYSLIDGSPSASFVDGTSSFFLITLNQTSGQPIAQKDPKLSWPNINNALLFGDRIFAIQDFKFNYVYF
jgi:hypothetical protein